MTRMAGGAAPTTRGATTTAGDGGTIATGAVTIGGWAATGVGTAAAGGGRTTEGATPRGDGAGGTAATTGGGAIAGGDATTTGGRNVASGGATATTGEGGRLPVTTAVPPVDTTCPGVVRTGVLSCTTTVRWGRTVIPVSVHRPAPQEAVAEWLMLRPPGPVTVPVDENCPGAVRVTLCEVVAVRPLGPVTVPVREQVPAAQLVDVVCAMVRPSGPVSVLDVENCPGAVRVTVSDVVAVRPLGPVSVSSCEQEPPPHVVWPEAVADLPSGPCTTCEDDTCPGAVRATLRACHHSADAGTVPNARIAHTAAT